MKTVSLIFHPFLILYNNKFDLMVQLNGNVIAVDLYL